MESNSTQLPTSNTTNREVATEVIHSSSTSIADISTKQYETTSEVLPNRSITTNKTPLTTSILLETNQNQLYIIIGSVLGFLVIAVIIIVIVCCIYRFKFKPKHQTNRSPGINNIPSSIDIHIPRPTVRAGSNPVQSQFSGEVSRRRNDMLLTPIPVPGHSVQPAPPGGQALSNDQATGPSANNTRNYPYVNQKVIEELHQKQLSRDNQDLSNNQNSRDFEEMRRIDSTSSMPGYQAPAPYVNAEVIAEFHRNDEGGHQEIYVNTGVQEERGNGYVAADNFDEGQFYENTTVQKQSNQRNGTPFNRPIQDTYRSNPAISNVPIAEDPTEDYENVSRSVQHLPRLLHHIDQSPPETNTKTYQRPWDKLHSELKSHLKEHEKDDNQETTAQSIIRTNRVTDRQTRGISTSSFWREMEREGGGPVDEPVHFKQSMTELPQNVFSGRPAFKGAWRFT